MERERVHFPAGSNIDSAVYLLLSYKARGVHAYGVFNGYELDSETVSMDGAYKKILGCTKEEWDEKQRQSRIEYERQEKEREIREAGYKNTVAEHRANSDGIITMDKVIAGLKFIAENQEISQEEMIQGLLDLGCDFSFDDIKRQFPDQGLLFDSMRKCYASGGASLIVNARDSEGGRAYVEDRFLSLDDYTSIYHFIRVVTGDESYTKENIVGKGVRM